MEEHKWFGFSLTSGRADDQPRTSRLGEVTIARMPETSDTDTATTPDWSGDPRGAPEAMVHDQQFGDLSPGTWGPRVADEDLDLVIRGLFPARGLRIEEPMADCQSRGTKRPSEEERRDRLQKMARLGKGKGKAGTSAEATPSRGVMPPTVPFIDVAVPPAAPASQVAMPQVALAPRSSDCSESRSSRPWDDRPIVAAPTPRSHREDLRPQNVPTSRDELATQKLAHRVLVFKFGEKLTLEVAGSSKRSDPVAAFSDCADKLIEDLCLAFFGSAAVRGYANRMTDEVKSAEAEAQSTRQAEKDAKATRDAARETQKKAEVRAKSAEDRAKSAEEWARIANKDLSNGEIARCGMEEALRKAESDLAFARVKHDRYIKVVLPSALEEARAQAVDDFL
ncbi:hypothetical protein TIFTF001_047250 [Ficus carica]|uniref:Uncharacterized protein n=1 Tax=Ficus carica TaxID=3494 RepID=A0AA88CLJ4_FICCA|nr:hypothetical protein TIFTF001_047237 [Ficus carica]GMN21235.1 hypothetical protein TIFTF001_047241 [Ficus carica]GMN21248.1 hypothetical protein TIFTF001_047246 [Ficus carica]GMN21266.1 hypothetical protein TIFTF001_047250 [Ficus carica]